MGKSLELSEVTESFIFDGKASGLTLKK